MIFDKLVSLKDIKEDPYVIEHIRWDLRPKDLMEPRCFITDEGLKTREAIKGYVFYIDTTDKKPILFLMRHTTVGYAETAAQIDEIPQELLLEAVEESRDRVYFSMYPINKKVEEWLKRELGVL
jgi:hypothetical protein